MALTYTQLANGDASFTPAGDGAWGEHDAQTILGSIPVSVVLEILLENNNAGNEYSIGVREKGSGLSRAFPIHEAEGGGATHNVMFVQTDADGKFEAYSDDVSRTTHHIMGYFAGVTYTEMLSTWNSDNNDDAWHNKDFFTDFTVPKESVCEVVVRNNQAASSINVGIRQNGSAIDRKILLHEAEAGGQVHISMFVETDVDGVIEFYDDSTASQALWLIGYFDSTVGFTERHDTLDAAGDAGWEDEALNGYGVPASAVVAIICLNGEFGAENELGVREDGTAIDRKWDEHEAGSANGAEYTGFRLCVTAGADANRTIDIYEEDTSENILYHHGWFTTGPPPPVGTNPGFSIIPLMVATGMIA